MRATQLAPALAFGPDLALVVCGGNDAFRPAYDADNVDAELTAMIVALQQADADVITVGMFDVSYSPAVPEALRPGLRERMRLLSARTAKLAERLGTVHVHLTDHPLTADPTLYSTDGRHGSGRSDAIATAETLRRLHRPPGWLRKLTRRTGITSRPPNRLRAGVGRRESHGAPPRPRFSYSDVRRDHPRRRRWSTRISRHVSGECGRPGGPSSTGEPIAAVSAAGDGRSEIYMRRVRTLTVVIGAFALAVAGSVPAQAVSGGQPVTDNSYPFIAKVDFGAAVRSCTGTLLDPHWVVTAASCVSETGQPPVAGAPTQATTVTVGRVDLASTGGQVRTAVSVVPHPTENLALIRLNQPVTTSAPARIGAAPAVDEQLQALGYGAPPPSGSRTGCTVARSASPR